MDFQPKIGIPDIIYLLEGLVGAGVELGGPVVVQQPLLESGPALFCVGDWEGWLGRCWSLILPGSHMGLGLGMATTSGGNPVPVGMFWRGTAT